MQRDHWQHCNYLVPNCLKSYSTPVKNRNQSFLSGTKSEEKFPWYSEFSWAALAFAADLPTKVQYTWVQNLHGNHQLFVNCEGFRRELCNLKCALDSHDSNLSICQNFQWQMTIHSENCTHFRVCQKEVWTIFVWCRHSVHCPENTASQWTEFYCTVWTCPTATCPRCGTHRVFEDGNEEDFLQVELGLNTCAWLTLRAPRFLNSCKLFEVVLSLRPLHQWLCVVFHHVVQVTYDRGRQLVDLHTTMHCPLTSAEMHSLLACTKIRPVGFCKDTVLTTCKDARPIDLCRNALPNDWYRQTCSVQGGNTHWLVHSGLCSDAAWRIPSETGLAQLRALKACGGMWERVFRWRCFVLSL